MKEKISNIIKDEKKLTIITLLMLIIIPSLWLIPKGLPWSHDIQYHYTRLVGLTETIKHGDFIALIHDTLNGYGYENGLFYANFFFYPIAFLSLLGISYINAYKIMLLIINIITIIVSYKCFKNILNNNKYALFTTTIYSLSTYRVMDFIVRGATGENLSLIFIPVIILGLYELIYRDYKKWYIFTIGFVFLLLSHLITTIFMGIIVLIIILINYKRFFKEKQRIKYLIISAITGLLIGAFFIIPIIEAYLDKNIQIFTEGSQVTQPYDFRVTLFELFFPKELLLKNIGYGIYILLPIIYYFRKDKHKNNDLISFSNILIILGIICMIFTTAIFPWKYIGKYLTFIQFPWRLLVVATPFISLGISIYIMNIKKKEYLKIIKKICIASIIITFIVTLGYSSVYMLFLKRNTSFDQFVGPGEYLLTGTQIYNEENILDNELINENNYKTNNENLVYTYDKDGKNINIEYSNNNQENTYIEVPLFNYKGYKVEGAEIVNGENNVIRLNINDEQGNIKLYYQMTLIQKIAYIISAISWLVFIPYLIIKKRNN